MDCNNSLRLLPVAEVFSIPSCDGNRALTGDREILNSWVSSSLADLFTESKSKETIETSLNAYAVTGKGSYKEIFGSLSSDLDVVCLTQDQIVCFAEKYSNWLRQGGYVTWFLFKCGVTFLVASVQKEDFNPAIGLKSKIGLGGSVYRFADTFQWDTCDFPQCIVAPHRTL